MPLARHFSHLSFHFSGSAPAMTPCPDIEYYIIYGPDIPQFSTMQDSLCKVSDART